MADLETLSRDVCASKHRILNLFSLDCTSGLFTLKFSLLVHVIKDTSRFGSFSELDALSCEQFNTSINAQNHLISKRRATSLNELVFGLNQIQYNLLWERLHGSHEFSTSVGMKKITYNKKKEVIW